MEEPGVNFSQAVLDLKTLSEALSMAVACHFMAPAHAANVWKKWLKTSEIDVNSTDKTVTV